MLRAAIKYGVSEALSVRPGFEVWDFDLQEKQDDDFVTLLITYRYHRGCTFKAIFEPVDLDSGLPRYSISVEHRPGEIREVDRFMLEGRHELFDALERWTGCLEEELLSKSSSSVLGAQRRALAKLETHVRELPQVPIQPDHAAMYRERLDTLEDAIIRLHPEDEDDIRDEFDSLRDRVRFFDERSFFRAVLVRLIRYFWDERNLQLVSAGQQAAEDFLGFRGQGTSQANRGVRAVLEKL
jgi:hypothetical protein